MLKRIDEQEVLNWARDNGHYGDMATDILADKNIWATAQLAADQKELDAEKSKVVEEIFKNLKLPCPHIHKVLPNRPQHACDICIENMEAKYGGK